MVDEQKPSDSEQKPSANAMLFVETLFVLVMALLIYVYGNVWGKWIIGTGIVSLLVIMLSVFHPELASKLVDGIADRIRGGVDKDDNTLTKPN